MNAKHGRNVRTVSEPVMQLFQDFAWPGNVRELRNTLERAVIVCDSTVIEPRHLPPGFGSITAAHRARRRQWHPRWVGTTVEEAETQLIIKTLESPTTTRRGRRKSSASASRPCTIS